MSDLLSEAHLRTLRAAVDRLIPPDDFPGAWEAGCGEYIIRQLQGQLAHLAAEYREGLESLDSRANTLFGRPFADLEPAQQDQILADLDASEQPVTQLEGDRRFFRNLVNHVAEGYYADPTQGGNRNRISWRMIGFNGR